MKKSIDLTELDFEIPSFIKRVTKEEAKQIIIGYKSEDGDIVEKHKGCFYFEENGVYIALDNSEGDCWIEEFTKLENCIAYLCGDNSSLEFTTVAEFLSYAFDYLKEYRELEYESEERMSGKTRTDEEVYAIILDKEKFLETYDILEQEADYHEIAIEHILENLHEIKKRMDI